MSGESYTTQKIILKSVTGNATQYFVPYVNNASSDTVGLVKPDGTTITVDANGVITAATATASALGIVKPDGTTVTISNGVISAPHQTIKQDGITGATTNRFGTCATAAGTAAKTVNIRTGTFSLETGARVTVKFSNANTADSPTLAVNSTAAKNIFFAGSQITTSEAKRMLAGTVDFVYDGTQWQLVVPDWESYLTTKLDALVNTLNDAVA